jgi:ectoine hydrolase
LPTPSPLFDRAEYAARLGAARAAMEEARIDALVIVDPANMNWLTGYDGWSFYVPQAVVAFPDRDPLWWGRPMDLPGAARTVWMADDRLADYPDHLVQQPGAHAWSALSALLADAGLRRARIGLELDAHFMTAACAEALRIHLPEAHPRDATGLVNRLRAVKSPAELALMARAARRVEAMHAAIREHFRPGLPKCDLVAEVIAAGVRGGGDYPAIAPIAPSGAEAAAAHLTWDDAPLRPGEATYFEIAGCVRRYHCPLSRTYHTGPLPDDLRRAQDAVMAALEAGLAAARPGETAEAVAAAVYAALRAGGFEKTSRTGYGVGVGYPPDWGERNVSLRMGDLTPLAENQTLHLMPGLWTPAWGVAITETFVVTASGGRPLADVPRPIYAV